MLVSPAVCPQLFVLNQRQSPARLWAQCGTSCLRVCVCRCRTEFPQIRGIRMCGHSTVTAGPGLTPGPARPLSCVTLSQPFVSAQDAAGHTSWAGHLSQSPFSSRSLESLVPAHLEGSPVVLVPGWTQVWCLGRGLWCCHVPPCVLQQETQMAACPRLVTRRCLWAGLRLPLWLISNPRGDFRPCRHPVPMNFLPMSSVSLTVPPDPVRRLSVLCFLLSVTVTGFSHPVHYSVAVHRCHHFDALVVPFGHLRCLCP